MIYYEHEYFLLCLLRAPQEMMSQKQQAYLGTHILISNTILQ